MMTTRITLLLLCLAGLLSGLVQAGQSGEPLQQFSKDGLTFSYPAGWVLRDESTPQEQSILLIRNEYSRILVFSPRAASSSQTDLATARQSFIEPSIDEIVRLAEARGMSVVRTPVSSEIAGSKAEGVRLRFTMDGTPRLYEIYWCALGGRIVSANFLTSEQDALPTRAAWDVLRNSLTLKQAQTSSQQPCPDNLSNQQILETYQQARSLRESGRTDEAIALLECVIKELERVLVKPEDQEPVVHIYNELGQLYYEKEDYGKAEVAYRHALELAERFLPAGSGYLATSLSNLGSVFEARGEYSSAEPLIKRALQIFESEKPPVPSSVTAAMNNLAEVYYAQGRLVEAEPIYQRAMGIIEKLPTSERVELNDIYAQLLDNLGQLYDERGDYQSAEKFYQQAVAIADPSDGPKNPRLAIFLNDLGLLYYRIGNYEAAKQLLERALELKIRDLGPNHREVATTLNNLGMLLRVYELYDEALKVDQTALAIRERTLPPGHPDIALSLNNLGIRYRDKGDYANAASYLKRALTIYEQTLGPNSPYVALTLSNLGAVYEAQGDTKQALEYTTRGLDVRETNISLLIAAGSESQKLSYMSLLTGETDGVVSEDVELNGKNPQMTRLALTTILRRKGRVLDALSDIFGSLRKRLSPDVAPLLDNLASVRSQLATLVFRGPGQANPQQYRDAISQLESRERQLEADIGARSEQYRLQTQRVTVEAVQQAIPLESALVEFILYRSVNPRGKAQSTFGEPRYAAYVLQRTGDPALIPLGLAADLDSKVVQLRAKMRSPGYKDKELAQEVDKKLMAPVRAALGKVHNVFISTDGSLNLLPFAALADENGRYLIENYSFNYLTSGRDLLKLQTRSTAGQAPVAIVAPRFDKGNVSSSPTGTETGNTGGADDVADFSNLTFTSLPDTTREAAALKRYLPKTVILSGDDATEAAVRGLSGPSILHIATHGFFLVDQTSGVAKQVSLGPAIGNILQAPTMTVGGNPLLRSGLWLAGANQRNGGGTDNGVLTALETASLNLDGTELVMLSACETGSGDVQNGEGVYGLRRSLFIAGTRSAVVSLWKVNGDATADIMTKYYDHLLRKREGRTEALRQAQLEMLRNQDTNQDYSSPYFWAGFIPLGDWKAINSPKP